MAVLMPSGAAKQQKSGWAVYAIRLTLHGFDKPMG
jgi:hypothetical protein